MSEAIYNASGLGLPIVMTVANRALGSPINIWNDHSDAMSQRDSGWIQLYAESNQAAADLHVQAFRLAEELSLPVMVCMDGFVLTHAHERIDVPSAEQVDAFLPPFVPRQVLDPADPVTIGAMVGPEAFFEVKYLMHHKQLDALRAIPRIGEEFAAAFGRDGADLVRGYRSEDAETVVVALGSVMGDDQRVVGQRLGCRDPFNAPQPHRARLEVEVRHLREHDADVAIALEDRAQRIRDVARCQRPGRDLVAQRLEEVEVAPVDQRDLDRSAPESKDGLQPAETSADHHDAMSVRPGGWSGSRHADH